MTIADENMAATVTAGELAKKLRDSDCEALVLRFRGWSTDLEIHYRPFDGGNTYAVFSTEGRIHSFGSHKPTRGVWHKFYSDSLLEILYLLPRSAALRFEVSLDCHTNQYMETAVRGAPTTRHGLDVPNFEGLHGDALYLEALFEKRGKPVLKRFLIDTHTGAHNSARFGV